jgi:hypothetical protein
MNQHEEIISSYDNDTIIGNIRLPHDRHAEVTNLLSSTGHYCCTMEFTGCEHFHFAIRKPTVTRDTIAKKIRTTFPELKKDTFGGAKHYHVAAVKTPRYQFLYIFKEWHVTDNPFVMTNSPELQDHNSRQEFAQYCHSNYDDQVASFKKHTPGQFLEYLTKETQTIQLYKDGVPDLDLDELEDGSGPPGKSYWTSTDLRRNLVHDAITYLKRIDIATCGPNKIWDLVNYAHLHIDQNTYTLFILNSTYNL